MNQEERNSLGEKIRKYRKDKKLSIEAVAEGICHPSTLSQFERGKFTPNGVIIKQLCDRLGIATNDLLEKHSEKIEVDIALDIIKIHIQREEFESAAFLIESLKARTDLAIYQKQALSICEADYLILTHNLSLAVEKLSELQEELADNSEVDKRFLATVYNKLGTAHYLKASMVDAFSNYQNAYELISKFPEFDMLAASICYNLGNVCRRLGKDAEGLTYVTMAQRFYQNATDVKKLADALFVIGISYRNLNDLEKASSYFQQTLQLYETNNLFQDAEEVRYAYAYLVLRLTDSDQAVENLLGSAQKQTTYGNSPSKAYTYALLASIYMEKRDYLNAKKYLRNSMELFTEEMATTNGKYVAVYQIYAQYLYQIDELEECIKYATKSAQIYDNMGRPRDAADSLMILKQAYEKSGELKKSLKVSDQIIEKLQQTLGARLLWERG